MFNVRLFEAQLALIGITKAELAEKLGINPSTLTRKLQRDGDFTREEINEMIKILDIEHPETIFFA
jgi:DNA-binding NtrC family response regulator